jgi:hypothetical protein
MTPRASSWSTATPFYSRQPWPGWLRSVRRHSTQKLAAGSPSPRKSAREAGAAGQGEERYGDSRKFLSTRAGGQSPISSLARLEVLALPSDHSLSFRARKRENIRRLRRSRGRSGRTPSAILPIWDAEAKNDSLPRMRRLETSQLTGRLSVVRFSLHDRPDALSLQDRREAGSWGHGCRLQGRGHAAAWPWP